MSFREFLNEAKKPNLISRKDIYKEFEIFFPMPMSSTSQMLYQRWVTARDAFGLQLSKKKSVAKTEDGKDVLYKITDIRNALKHKTVQQNAFEFSADVIKKFGADKLVRMPETAE